MRKEREVAPGRRGMLRSVAAALGVGTGAALALTPGQADAAASVPAAVRRATEDGWSRARNVLRNGELGLATDTGVLKIGDGRRTWAQLPGYVDESNLEAALARRLGAALVVSRTPPASPTRFGLPVVWIDAATALTPVPAQPVAPTFDDAASSYTIPKDVVGVDYVVDGVMRTPGRTYTVRPPVTVTIAAQAQDGYSLIGDYSFGHDFPDPTRLTVLTSDSFSVTGLLGAVVDLLGRTTDAVLGGSPATWTSGGTAGTAMALAKAGGSGRLVNGTVANAWRKLDYPAVHNVQVEFDLLGISDAGATTAYMLSVELLGRGVSVQMGQHRMRIQCANHSGGALDLQFGVGVPSPTGHWTIRLFGNTLTVVDGGGTVRTWHLDPATYDVGGEDAGVSVAIRNQATAANGFTWSLGGLVVKKIG